MADQFNMFLPIAKVDEEKRLVSGYASTERRDSDGEIIELAAVKQALPDYLEYGNIREMHKLNAVGVAAETNIDTKGLYLTAYIADDEAWKKCLPSKLPDGTIIPPVYKGFSIGGRKLDKKGDRITQLELLEISVVDRPANPDCRIDIAKSAKSMGQASGFLVKPKKIKRSPESKAVAKMAKIIEELAKSGPPAAHDGFSLPAKITKDDDVVEEAKKGEGDMLCDKHGKANCPECSVEKTDDTAPKGKYGDVEYADPGHREDKKPRYPIDTEEHIRAAWNYIHKKKNAAKYSSEQASQIKAKIVAAWKAKIDKEGPPSVDDKSAAKAAAIAELEKSLTLKGASFLSLRKSSRGDAIPGLSLRKGMGSVGSLAYSFDSIRDVQRRLMMEAKREGGDGKDKALATKLGTLAKDLANVISLKAEHEGDEATTLTDADDQYLASMLGEGFNDMSNVDKVGGKFAGDPLATALEAFMKRAAAPT